jgi:dTDP-4-dehydrorhamnose reductase
MSWPQGSAQECLPNDLAIWIRFSSLAPQRDDIAFVSGQWGNPTSALEIAGAIRHVAEMLHATGELPAFGIYHLAGTGAVNRAAFARHVLATSTQYSGTHAAVRDAATANYLTNARRPLNSRLSTGKFVARVGWATPEWRQATEEVVVRFAGGLPGEDLG